MGTMAAVGPCEMTCSAPSSVVSVCLPSKDIGVPLTTSRMPTTSDSGIRMRVTLRVRKTQKLPMVFVVLPASAFMTPAMAAMPQAAVTNWKSMMTNNWVK